MSPARLTGIALATIALGGVAAWTVVDQRTPGARMMSAPAAAQEALRSPTAQRADRVPDRSGPDHATSPVPAKTIPAPTAKIPKAHGTPAPFVQSFAAQPGRSRIRPRKSPTAPVRVAPTVDGCDRYYGTKAQCIPATFPKGVTDRCAWLKAHGFTTIKVVVKDRQNLDPDGNKIACG